MSTIAAAISVTAAAASHGGGRRRRSGSVSVRCASAADERQALFSRIAPVYDHVCTTRSPPSFS
jgi:demethylmenaquinone methyltransferase/2-methoxy-6-polyprenyl-1,4-benzoquinol methylase